MASQVAALAETHPIILGIVGWIIVFMVNGKDDVVGPIGPSTVLTGPVSLLNSLLTELRLVIRI